MNGSLGYSVSIATLSAGARGVIDEMLADVAANPRYQDMSPDLTELEPGTFIPVCDLLLDILPKRKYRVTLYKPVMDWLTTTVIVEATSASAAD